MLWWSNELGMTQILTDKLQRICLVSFYLIHWVTKSNGVKLHFFLFMLMLQVQKLQLVFSFVLSTS